MTTFDTLTILSTPMDDLLEIIATNILDNINEPWMDYAVNLYGVGSVLRMPENSLVDGGYNLMNVGTVRRWAAEL